MMLRLVLVGMVAALGVSIPGKPSCEHWFDSAEAWATTLLAEWDTWEPTEGAGSTLLGMQDHQECEQCRLARMRVAANAVAAALAPLGVTLCELPLSPSHMWKLVNGKVNSPKGLT